MSPTGRVCLPPPAWSPVQHPNSARHPWELQKRAGHTRKQPGSLVSRNERSARGAHGFLVSPHGARRRQTLQHCRPWSRCWQAVGAQQRSACTSRSGSLGWFRLPGDTWSSLGICSCHRWGGGATGTWCAEAEDATRPTLRTAPGQTSLPQAPLVPRGRNADSDDAGQRTGSGTGAQPEKEGATWGRSREPFARWRLLSWSPGSCLLGLIVTRLPRSQRWLRLRSGDGPVAVTRGCLSGALPEVPAGSGQS